MVRRSPRRSPTHCFLICGPEAAGSTSAESLSRCLLSMRRSHGCERYSKQPFTKLLELLRRFRFLSQRSTTPYGIVDRLVERIRLRRKVSGFRLTAPMKRSMVLKISSRNSRPRMCLSNTSDSPPRKTSPLKMELRGNETPSFDRSFGGFQKKG